MLQGLDVSQYQGRIDWSEVPPQYEFVIVKMTGGDNGLYIDPQGKANYNGAKSTGRLVGGYHVAGGGDPIAECNFFIESMSPVQTYDYFVLDIEPETLPPNGGWNGWAITFMDRLQQACDVWGIRYLDISQTNAMGDPGNLSQCGLWIAAPSYTPEQNVPIALEYIIQQGATATVPGIPTAVDTNVAFLTREELQDYGIKPPSPAPEPTAPSVSVSTPTPEAPPIVPPTTPVETDPTVPVVNQPLPPTTPTLTKPVIVSPQTPKPLTFWQEVLKTLKALVGIV